VGSGPATCAQVAYWEANEQLPTGGVPIVQFQSGPISSGLDLDQDYAC
jgi:hypothetical protein